MADVMLDWSGCEGGGENRFFLVNFLKGKLTEFAGGLYSRVGGKEKKQS